MGKKGATQADPIVGPEKVQFRLSEVEQETVLRALEKMGSKKYVDAIRLSLRVLKIALDVEDRGGYLAVVEPEGDPKGVFLG